MLATAIWATPRLRMLRTLPGPVSGRVLADDLLLMTEGPTGEDEEVYHNHSVAFEATVDFIQDSGATLSLEKTFSACTTKRS
eukprot:15337942-Alexandrium_andersonii.AAC.1